MESVQKVDQVFSGEPERTSNLFRSPRSAVEEGEESELGSRYADHAPAASAQNAPRYRGAARLHQGSKICAIAFRILDASSSRMDDSSRFGAWRGE